MSKLQGQASRLPDERTTSASTNNDSSSASPTGAGETPALRPRTHQTTCLVCEFLQDLAHVRDCTIRSPRRRADHAEDIARCAQETPFPEDGVHPDQRTKI